MKKEIKGKKEESTMTPAMKNIPWDRVGFSEYARKQYKTDKKLKSVVDTCVNTMMEVFKEDKLRPSTESNVKKMLTDYCLLGEGFVTKNEIERKDNIFYIVPESVGDINKFKKESLMFCMMNFELGGKRVGKIRGVSKLMNYFIDKENGKKRETPGECLLPHKLEVLKLKKFIEGR